MHKVNGKILNNYYDNVNLSEYNNPKDTSGNKIGKGDYVLYSPGTKYTDSYITQILEETIEGTCTNILCIKLKNKQYKTLRYAECYLVTPDFMALHSKLVFKS